LETEVIRREKRAISIPGAISRLGSVKTGGSQCFERNIWKAEKEAGKGLRNANRRQTRRTGSVDSSQQKKTSAPNTMRSICEKRGEIKAGDDKFEIIKISQDLRNTKKRVIGTLQLNQIGVKYG